MDEWLRPAEVAEVLGVTSRAVRARASRNGWEYREVTPEHGGRAALEYRTACLPVEARAVLAKRQAEAAAAAGSTSLALVGAEDRDARALAQAPAKERHRALAWLSLFQLVDDATGDDLDAAITAWATARGEKAPSVRTYYRQRKKYDAKGAAGLMRQYGNRAGESVIEDHHFAMFRALYLHEGRPMLAECVRRVWDAVAVRGGCLPDPLPHERSFQRRLDREVPEGVQYAARYGMKAWGNKYGRYVERDPGSIEAGQVWVSDHRQLDVHVLLPDGRTVRPWLTSWMDMRTFRFLSWHLHAEAPNSGQVFLGFRWGVEAAQFLPDMVYLDNGRDYTTIDFAGDQHRTRTEAAGPLSVRKGKDAAQGLLSALGVVATFAIPGNARAKTIERRFQEQIGRLEKHLVGYAGRHNQAKPEKLKRELAAGRLLTLREVDGLVSTVHAQMNAATSEGKYLDGDTPDGAWTRLVAERPASALRTLTPVQTALLIQRQSQPKTIGRNGVRIKLPRETQARTWWGEWMEPLKGGQTRVVVRVDPRHPDRAFVLSAATGELLGEAYPDRHTTSAWARTPDERSELTGVLQDQRAERSRTVAQVQDLRGGGRGHARAGHDLVVETLRAGGQGGTLTAGGPGALGGQAAPVAVDGTPLQTDRDAIEAEAQALRQTGTGDLPQIPAAAARPTLKLLPSDDA